MALADHRIRVFKNPSRLERFINTAAAAPVLVSGSHTFGFTFGAVGETLIVEGSVDGGLTFTAFKRTFAVLDVGAHANIAALLAEVNTDAQWDGGTLPTEFLITNSSDTLVITHAEVGEEFALRISLESTALGAVTDEDLLFTAGVVARGGFGSVGLLTVEHLLTDDNGTLILVYTV